VNRDQSLPPNDSPRASHPSSVTTIKVEEPQEILTIEKHKVSLLIDTGASISAIPFSPEPRCSKKVTVWGISGQPLECYFTQTLVSRLLLGRFPLLTLLFNCCRNPYSARAKTFFLNWGYSSFYHQESNFAYS
jgi:hypothetical protein